MKYRYSFLIFLFATLIQGTALNAIAIFNITPNLILCLVVMFSFLYNNEYHGVIFGTLFGLAADILFLQFAGVSALGYFLTALFVMSASRVFNRENFMNSMWIVAAATVIFSIYSLIVYAMLDAGVNPLYMLKKLPFMAIYNCAVSAVLYQIFINKVIRFRSDRFYR